MIPPMSRAKYLTAPVASPRMPPGVPYIIGNEAAERFSFYGMKAILVVFMTQYLRARGEGSGVMSEANATFWYHFFTWGVYFTPIFGALLSDGLLGKYPTIILLSLVYCFGHFALAIDDTWVGLAIGLTLIAVGAGGIKPCVSAHVGDQFGQTNAYLLPRVFAWFYFAINFGSFFSTVLTPYLLDRHGPNVAFAVPGVLMVLATVVFWMGRWKFVHVPAGGMAFIRETFSGKGLSVILRLSIIFLFVAPFWSLFDQTGSSWVLQAERMDRRIFGYEVLSSQVQAVNPLLIMVLVPLFSYAVYPALGRLLRVTALRKILLGFFVAAAAFAIVALAEIRIQAGARPSIGWQLAAYLILTCAEVMVSITCLEFAYTQAPRKMKSLIMSLFLMSVAVGNAFTAGVNRVIQRPDGSSRLSGPSYFWFFTGVMLATAVLFIVVVAFYRERTYVQEEQPAPPESGAFPVADERIQK
jgi:proton-dependent oligopeptide transporter, POT family